jgi:hypothetical protein
MLSDTPTMDKPMEFGVKINDKTQKSQDSAVNNHIN